jgi:hypothetical protein
VVSYVAQPNDYGCAIACVAMIVGKTYADMEAWFLAHGLAPARMEKGVHDGVYFEALARHGFAYQQRWRCNPFTNVMRDDWPPAPFAPVHICSGAVAAGHHAFVMLADGRVLDPWTTTRTTIDHPDYLQVHSVAGVYRMPA